MELLLGHEKIITKSGISLNAGTLIRGFTVLLMQCTVSGKRSRFFVGMYQQTLYETQLKIIT
jgi:hypothetical protein